MKRIVRRSLLTLVAAGALTVPFAGVMSTGNAAGRARATPSETASPTPSTATSRTWRTARPAVRQSKPLAPRVAMSSRPSRPGRGRTTPPTPRTLPGADPLVSSSRTVSTSLRSAAQRSNAQQAPGSSTRTPRPLGRGISVYGFCRGSPWSDCSHEGVACDSAIHWGNRARLAGQRDDPRFVVREPCWRRTQSIGARRCALPAADSAAAMDYVASWARHRSGLDVTSMEQLWSLT